AMFSGVMTLSVASSGGSRWAMRGIAMDVLETSNVHYSFVVDIEQAYVCDLFRTRPTDAKLFARFSFPICLRNMTQISLSNKTCLITGGGSGIGLGCAVALAREGCQVAIAGRREDVLKQGAATWTG